jgi:hypothetical protein
MAGRFDKARRHFLFRLAGVQQLRSGHTPAKLLLVWITTR